MKPTFEILVGDNLHLLTQVPNESVDLILTDPSYGIDYQSNRRVKHPKFPKMAGDKNLNWLPSFIDQCFRVLRDESHFLCFCSWRTYPTFYYSIVDKLHVRSLIVWVKNNHGSGDLKHSFSPQYELIVHATKGNPRLIGKRPPNLIMVPTIPSLQRYNAVEKPVDLLKYLIGCTTTREQVVLDPFCGSGSTGLAALSLGRRFIGMDIVEEQCKVSRERLKGFTNGCSR